MNDKGNQIVFAQYHRQHYVTKQRFLRATLIKRLSLICDKYLKSMQMSGNETFEKCICMKSFNLSSRSEIEYILFLKHFLKTRAHKKPLLEFWNKHSK